MPKFLHPRHSENTLLVATSVVEVVEDPADAHPNFVAGILEPVVAVLVAYTVAVLVAYIAAVLVAYTAAVHSLVAISFVQHTTQDPSIVEPAEASFEVALQGSER